MIRYVMFNKNYIDSKLAGEVLASAVSSVSSSSFDITLEMPVQQEYKIDVKGNVINVSVGSDSYSSEIILPYYIKLNEKSFSSVGSLVITKTNDEVDIS